jgi:hypothetical protein
MFLTALYSTRIVDMKLQMLAHAKHYPLTLFNIHYPPSIGYLDDQGSQKMKKVRTFPVKNDLGTILNQL